MHRSPLSTSGGAVLRSAAVCGVLLLSAPVVATAQDDVPPRPVVRQLSFDGNRTISDETLRLAIATSRSSFFARAGVVRWLGLGQERYFNAGEFRRDVLRIKALYGASGFPEAEVDTIVRRSANGVDILFPIVEGAPVRVSSIEVTGLPAGVPVAEVRDALPLHVGRPFNRLLLQTSADVVQAFARDRGYPYVRVVASFSEGGSGGAVDILFATDPGPRARIGEITVRGAERIDEGVVRATLALERGQLFSAQRLYDSQLNLYRTQLFRSVSVALVDSLPDDDGDSLVTIEVRVLEGTQQRVRFGGGYGTLDCFRVSGSWDRQGVLGRRLLRIAGRVSRIGVGSPVEAGFESSLCSALRTEAPERRKLDYSVNLSMTEPLFIGRSEATLSAFGERHTEFRAYLRETVGADLSVSAELANSLPLTVSYGLSRGRTVADPVTFCSFLNVCRVEDAAVFTDSRVRSAVSVGIARDSRNAALAATRGTTASTELRWASRVIGSDSLVQFAKAVVEMAVYRRLGPVTFAGRVRAGTIIAPSVTLSQGRRRFVPPEERFYSGGPNSVRGFTPNLLGQVVRVLDSVAVDGAGRLDSIMLTSAVGGNELLVVNAELRFALSRTGSVAGAVFVDAGRVVDRDEPGETVRITPGFGIRIRSPLGPVRVDLGFNPHPPQRGRLYKREGSQLVLVDPAYRPAVSFADRLRVHFSIGQAF